MPRTRGPDGLFTFELRLAVHAQRPRRVVLDPRLIAGPVEHVVGAVVHQAGAEGFSLARQHGGPLRVDGAGEPGLAFRLVDGGVGGCIDYHLWTQRTHRRDQILRPRKIAA
jgi:hypothetical protein